MSKNFEKIKKYYDEGYWNKTKVKNMVTIKVNPITKEEYKQITGEDYE